VATRSPSPSLLTLGIFLILATAALRLGAGLLLPVAVAILFMLLLNRPVRLLNGWGVPPAVGAALLVFGTVGVVGFGAVMLARPAAKWIEDAPRTISRVQTRVQELIRPLQTAADRVEEATEAASPDRPPSVRLEGPGMLDRLRVGTAGLVATAVSVIFLTFFLLATLPVIRPRLADFLETGAQDQEMEPVLTELESQMSQWLLINTLTSIGVGIAVGVLLAVVGLPNPVLWGSLAGLLNFVPYLGPVIATGLVAAVALVTFDTTGPVLVAVGGCVAVNTLEGNLITPRLLGRSLPLNPVAIFLSLLYWGWVWGPVGALLAVPVTVMLQVALTRSRRFQKFAVLLGR
jgi:predicted PurR-regulated permease PerM